MTILARLPAFVAAICLVCGTVLAHGGQYCGPSSGGPGVPNVPLSPGAPVAGGPTTGGNANLDLNSWQVWWQLNQARYVGSAGNATDNDRRDVVMPALQLALEQTKSADVLSAALIAMGKSAVDHPKSDVLQVLKKHLANANGEVREAAVLALGLCGKPEAIDDLAGLLNDTRAGHKLVDRSNVDERVRTFAGYALGLLAQRTDSAAVVQKVLEPLVEALGDKGLKERDVLTGALNGMRLLGLNEGQDAQFKRIRWQAIDALEAHLERRLSSKLAVAQSHALTALAQIARNGSDRDRERVIGLAIDVLERGREAEAATYVSATIALGELLRPGHVEAIAVLVKQIKQPRDSLIPKFAMIAFGQIGGQTAFEELENGLRDGKRDLQPWAALGLGLLSHEPEVKVTPAVGTRSVKQDFRAEVAGVLQDALMSENNDELLAAIAIGLGLAGTRSAAPLLRKVAADTKSEEHKGHLLVALALLDDRQSIGLATAGMATVRDPVYFGHSALALAQYGERGASKDAVSRLAGITLSPGYLTWLAASAQAIGHLENAADLPALVDMVLEKQGRSSRGTRFHAGIDAYRAAFAAAAIGSISDRDPLGFRAQVARGMNYTPREQTISNGTTGILDIF